MSILQVPIEQLSLNYPDDYFHFTSTLELEDLKEVLGQERALISLQFGTEMDSPGYNIYCLGPSGFGQHQIIEQSLRSRAARLPRAKDWIYVHNFEDSDCPIAIDLPSGEAKHFRRQMQKVLEDLQTTIPSIFEGERFRRQRESLSKEFKDKQDKTLNDIQERAKKENVYLLTVRGGLLFAQGDKDGNLLGDDELAKIPEEEQKVILARLQKYNEELARVIGDFPILEKQFRGRLKEFSKEMIAGTVDSLMREIRERFSYNVKLNEYLEKVHHDIIENARFFRHVGDEKLDIFDRLRSPLKLYEVNVLVENSAAEGAPVVYENNPTFMNLVGQIEHSSQMGAVITDFTLIKAGALHRANGGFLILDARKLLSSAYAWEGLKRALKSGEIQIESLGQVYSLFSTVSLKPQPVSLNCKIILIGDDQVYNLLMNYDPEFIELFKITSAFQEEIRRTSETEHLFLRMLATRAREQRVLPLKAGGAARMLSHCVRLAGDNERISLCSGAIDNLLKEASYFASRDSKSYIERADVQKAIDAQVGRVSLLYERILEETLRGLFLVDVIGKKVGQVNALSIFDFGQFRFGRGTRVTAAVRMGEGHLIDIERESKLGGPIHSKGVLILSGYLKSHYATEIPLSISASIVFEQSYGLVEGDSASLAELCALLSAISKLDLQQAFAVTGSINQYGEVQPVGGVNEKIEGFFDLCCLKGLTGEQGVVFPRANLKNLNLRADVTKAVEQNQFRIFAVDTADDCMQVLTGLPAPLINERIESRLRSFTEQIRGGKKECLIQGRAESDALESSAH
jgi:predicted ATP-dependent protease